VVSYPRLQSLASRRIEAKGAAAEDRRIPVQRRSPCSRTSDPPCGKPYHRSLEIFGCCCKVLRIVLAADGVGPIALPGTSPDDPCPSFVLDPLSQMDRSSRNVAADEVVAKF